MPSRSELNEIYADSYFVEAARGGAGQGYRDYVADEDTHRLSARKRLAILERTLSPGRLLDVGAAAGFFVDEAGRHGWHAQGVDVSEVMTAWARDHVGVEVALGDPRELELPIGAFDVVTMWDYIEHSRDPAGDVSLAHKLLRSGGVLALSTGDADTIFARATGRHWHLLTPRHHNFFFTARTISLLLRRRGFRVLDVGHPGASYPLSYLAYKLRTMVDVRPVRSAGDWIGRSELGRVAVPVNLFDIVTVIARREESCDA